MIVVRVELHSAITGQVTELARAHIVNTGGTDKVRDYAVTTLRGRSRQSLDRGQVQRRGKVLGHRSLDLHVWHLVAKALTGIGYGRAPQPACAARLFGARRLHHLIVLYMGGTPEASHAALQDDGEIHKATHELLTGTCPIDWIERQIDAELEDRTRWQKGLAT